MVEVLLGVRSILRVGSASMCRKCLCTEKHFPVAEVLLRGKVKKCFVMEEVPRRASSTSMCKKYFFVH